MSEIPKAARDCAPVLEKMVELLGSEDCQGTFDEALQQAEVLTGVEVPEEMRGHMLMAAFKIAASGKIPGLPEA